MYNGNLQNVKEFDELLAELDAMIKADFIRFKQDLAKLSESYGLNTIFESETFNVEVEETSINLISENNRGIYNGADKVSSGENYT